MTGVQTCALPIYDQQWWAAIEPALAAVMDPAAFPVGGRVGRAVGEHLASVGDPAGSLDFGLDRIVDGVERILERKPRPDMAP